MSNRRKVVLAAVIIVTIGSAAAVVAVVRRNQKKVEDFTPIEGAGRAGYQCQQPRSVPASTLWPIPRDAMPVADEVYTKVLRRGTGTRHPRLGSGEVVVLCVTYYERSGAVREHHPAVIHEFDPVPSRWSDVAVLMTATEIRRVWMPDTESPAGIMIADFEMQPFPTMVKPRFGSPSR